MQLNFLQEDLLAAMQKTSASAPATPPIVLQRKPTKPAKPTQMPLIPEMEVAAPASAVKKPVMSAVVKEPAAVVHDDDKAPNAFKTISEAADILGVPTHVLRFWESQFSQISPTKSRGGRRYYRPEDMQVLTTIKHLLYKQGYTIKGARKALSQMKEGALVDAVPVSVPVKTATRSLLSDKQKAQLAAIRSELLGLREQLIPHLPQLA